MSVSRTLVGTAPKGQDLLTRVSWTEVNGVRVLELADFFPSRSETGRGYWLPEGPIADAICELVTSVRAEESGA